MVNLARLDISSADEICRLTVAVQEAQYFAFNRRRQRSPEPTTGNTTSQEDRSAFPSGLGSHCAESHRRHSKGCTRSDVQALQKDGMLLFSSDA